MPSQRRLAADNAGMHPSSSGSKTDNFGTSSNYILRGIGKSVVKCLGLFFSATPRLRVKYSPVFLPAGEFDSA